MIRNVLLVAALISTVASADAMDFKVVSAGDGASVMLATGDIVPGDAQRMLSLIESHSSREPVNSVMLISDGGAIRESEMLAKIIRELNLKTAVPENKYCVSACFELWAAGTTRIAGKGARIGVHRVHINGVETAETQATTIAYANRVKNLGVPRAILASMMLQPSAGMYYLTDADISSMGAVRYDMAEEEKKAAPTPQTPAPVAPSYQVTYAAPSVPVGEPQDLRAQRRAEFDETYSRAIEASKAQNRGRPAMTRNCDRKSCEEVLAFRDKNGCYVEMHKSLSTDSRALCRMTNPGVFSDEYLCKNWLTGESKTYRWSRDPLL